jgi:regulator of protease activity HflC (stomatin/prohibitin superfamily)
MHEQQLSKIIKVAILVVSILFIVGLVFATIRVNSPTEVSVVTRLGNIIGTKKSGLYFTIPLIDTVTKYDTTVQSVECVDNIGKPNCKTLDAATADLQNVRVALQVSYRIVGTDVEALYRLVQDQSTFNDIIVPAAIQESMKATTAQFKAEDLIQKRNEVNTKLSEVLNGKLAVFKLELVNLNIINFEFSATYNKAIEDKSVTQQLVLQKQAELEKAEAEAKIRITQAEAEAKAIKIQNDALQSNPGYLELQKIQKWDGKLPTYYGNGNLLFDMGKASQ